MSALGEVLKLFWHMSFKQRFSEKDIKIDVFEDYGEDIYNSI